jgi:periplasmic copper chaperone A
MSFPMKIFPLLVLSALALSAPAQAAPAPKVAIADAWCRPAPTGALSAGCYVTLTAGAEDRLVAVETTAADHAEIHSMSMDGGVMRMRKLDGLALPAGKAVTLKSGGEHLMLISPRIAFKDGAKIPLTFRFQKAAPMKVEAMVRAAAMPPMPGMSH